MSALPTTVSGHRPLSKPIPATMEQPSRVKVLLTVSFHITIAASVTLLNKWALNTVPLPNLILAFQTGICVLLSIVAKWSGYGVGQLMMPQQEIQSMWKYLVMRTVAVGMKVWCLNVSRPIIDTAKVSSSQPRSIKYRGDCYYR